MEKFYKMTSVSGRLQTRIREEGEYMVRIELWSNEQVFLGGWVGHKPCLGERTSLLTPDEYGPPKFGDWKQ